MSRVTPFFICLIAVFIFYGCGNRGAKIASAEGDTLSVIYKPRHAGRFELLTDNNVPILRVLNPWQGADNVTFDYRLIADTVDGIVFGENEIRWPIKKAVCISSSHVAFLDAVGQSSVIKGVSGLDFITNQALHKEEVKDVGYDNNLNYETIVALGVDVIFVYGLTGENAAVAKLQQLGVPVVYISDYLENDPLGRAEWVVPFGLLTGKMESAVEQFSQTERRYESLVAKVTESLSESVEKSVAERPKVMLNSPYKDVWYLPGDRNYMVRLVSDAGGDYLGKGEDSDVSRPVNAEKALLLMSEADYWLNPGMVQTMAQLKADNRRFATLPVARAGRVYNNNARTTPMGGSDFWESGVVRPDVVLSDLVRILHPELLPEHRLYYYRELR